MQYQLNNIRYHYDQRLILDIPSISLEAKKSYAILGPNGAGKSTLLNLLALVQPIQEGSIRFSHLEVNKENYKTIRDKIAYVQQKPFLFNMSVHENIELPLKLRGVNSKERKQKAQAIIEQCSLSHLAESNAKQLSGGEVQKVVWARALITEPKVLILDEPFTHLDVRTREEFETWLLDLKKQQKCTIIFSLHDSLKAHVLAHDVYQLRDGHLLDSNVMNLFSGSIIPGEKIFDTGNIKLHLPEKYEAGQHIAIDAKQIVLSKELITSSMQNRLEGKINSVKEYQEQILITIDAGERFQCIITHKALKELALHPGDNVWVSFKSSIIKTV